MSSGVSRKVTTEDIQTVQNLIEQCLPHYMTKEQVIDILFQQMKIEHEFTDLVWQRLEEENQEFFKIYHLRLALVKQISDFNNLLCRQAALMNQVDPNKVTYRPMSNGSYIPANELPVSNESDIPNHDSLSSCLMSENTIIHMRTGNMQRTIPTMQQAIPTVLSGDSHNHGVSMNSEMLHAQSIRFDVPPNMMWARNSNVRMVQGMNGVEIKTEPSHLRNSSFPYQAVANTMEAHPRIHVASTSSYGNMDPNRNGTVLNHDTSSFDVPRNFIHSQNIDLQSFYMSSIPLPDRSIVFDHHRSRIHIQGDNGRLYDTSGNLDFQNFGGNS